MLSSECFIESYRAVVHGCVLAYAQGWRCNGEVSALQHVGVSCWRALYRLLPVSRAIMYVAHICT